MKNILTENKLVKNLRAYPVLHKRWRGYIQGVRELPEGFTAEQLFHDYLKVRRSNPEKRVSMSEYMIFGFYGLTTAQQKQYLTDVEATLLMRPYNSAAEPYLKSKVTFLKNFTQFVSRGWLYLPESDLAAFDAFVHRYHSIALKPQYSSWGIGFRKLTEAEWDAAPDRQALFDELCAGKYLAEEFIRSDASLAHFHPESLNTLRVITFRRGERFEVFGAGLRVGNNGLHVDNAHGGGIFCEIDPATGVVTLPASGIQTVTLSATLTRGEATAYRNFDIRVWSQAELDKEAAKSELRKLVERLDGTITLTPDGTRT